MIVNSIYLDGFRNYSDISIGFEQGVNVIIGANAQGKTNMVEAIYYLTTGRSFRTSSDKDLISFNKDAAYIKAEVISAEREQILEARLFKERRREVFANNVKLKKMSELTGRLTSVMFGPDDLNIVKDGAVVRRKLMDQCISQLRPGYHAALTEFNKLYDNKTRILRDYREKPYLLDLLDDFNIRLARQSAKLIYYRSAFSIGISRRASDIHNEFSGGTEMLTVKYKTVGNINPAGKKPEQLLPELLEHQRELKQTELRSGHCLSGAHKDDLEIEINNSPARKFASQGQARTAAISFKLAEREIHHDDSGEYPILLLDDVLSELDPIRQSFVLSKIKNGQVFITCCDENAITTSCDGRVLRVSSGKIVELH